MLKDKISEILSKKGFMIALSFLGLYLFSTGSSWAMFSYLKGQPDLGSAGPGGRARLDLSLPKTEVCPINGEMFTKAERDIWEGRRPLIAVIENHLDSRPQSGLSRADLIYEVVAEGGITRFLSVFYCGASAQDLRIGPIRSARIYLINWATEYGDSPLFLHVGGANNICKNCPGGVKIPGTVTKEVRALEELIDLGWRRASGNALDAGANVGYPQVWRDPERIPGAAYEHTFMGSTDKLFDLGAERGFGYKDEDGAPWDKNFVKWNFSDDKPLPSPRATKISFEFWSNKPDYDVVWNYNAEKNIYMRENGGKPHIDLENKQELSAKNVIIQFVGEKGPVDKEGHMFYTTIGEGEALIFQNGDVLEGTWEKDSQSGRTKFFDSAGREVSLVRGVTWIEAVPDGNEISY